MQNKISSNLFQSNSYDVVLSYSIPFNGLARKAERDKKKTCYETPH